jgi:hypothetical protein
MKSDNSLPATERSVFIIIQLPLCTSRAIDLALI